MRRRVSWLARLGVSTATGIGTLVAGAIALAVLDLYLTGHGYGSLARPWIEWPSAGVRLSRADVVVLGLAVAATVVAWFASGERK